MRFFLPWFKQDGEDNCRKRTVLSKTDPKVRERMEVFGICDRQISRMNHNNSHPCIHTLV